MKAPDGEVIRERPDANHQGVAGWKVGRMMVKIRFPDREAQECAFAFLFGRFSGRVLRSGEHEVSEAAL
jgi:hypothetical protein